MSGRAVYEVWAICDGDLRVSTEPRGVNCGSRCTAMATHTGRCLFQLPYCTSPHFLSYVRLSLPLSVCLSVCHCACVISHRASLCPFRSPSLDATQSIRHYDVTRLWRGDCFFRCADGVGRMRDVVTSFHRSHSLAAESSDASRLLSEQSLTSWRPHQTVLWQSGTSLSAYVVKKWTPVCRTWACPTYRVGSGRVVSLFYFVGFMDRVRSNPCNRC